MDEHKGSEKTVKVVRHVSSDDLKWMGNYVDGRTYKAFNSGPLSQWHQVNFKDPSLPDTFNTHAFSSCEQYMMLHKALLFNDLKIANQIVEENDCKKIKALGRHVKNFSEEKWDEYKIDIVIRGNYLKFTQGETLKDFLLKTKPAFLVEGSMWDRIWGVGLDASNRNISDPRLWKGTNLLGKILTYVRQIIEDGGQVACVGSSLVCPSYNSDSESDDDLAPDEDVSFDLFKSRGFDAAA